MEQGLGVKFIQFTVLLAETFCNFKKVATIATLPTNFWTVHMKTMSSREAQNAFGSFLDTAQREPVMVTRRNRPVGVMLSMDNLPALLELADNIRETITAGVKAGLADAEAGKGQELNDDYVAGLKQELQARINAKQNR